MLAGFSGAFVAKRIADPHVSLGTTLTSMFDLAPDPQAVFHKDRLAILLLGIDYNYNAQDIEYSEGRAQRYHHGALARSAHALFACLIHTPRYEVHV